MLINFVDATNDANHYTKPPTEISVYSVYLFIHSFISTLAVIDFQRGRRRWSSDMVTTDEERVLLSNITMAIISRSND